MPKLKTETNTVGMESRVLAAALVALPEHQTNMAACFEHGQWWITCNSCGAQWSVADAADGFDFEQVTEGDEEEHDGIPS